jgi:hypothetical protein
LSPDRVKDSGSEEREKGQFKQHRELGPGEQVIRFGRVQRKDKIVGVGFRKIRVRGYFGKKASRQVLAYAEALHPEKSDLVGPIKKADFLRK